MRQLPGTELELLRLPQRWTCTDTGVYRNLDIQFSLLIDQGDSSAIVGREPAPMISAPDPEFGVPLADFADDLQRGFQYRVFTVSCSLRQRRTLADFPGR
jgi:hypothetical protein